MARISATSYPFSNLANWDAQTRELDALVEKSDNLPEGEVVGGLLKFPIADGNALYLVTAARPLTLQHVPFGDAYSVHPAMIRGLTKADVVQMLEHDRKFTDMFKHRVTPA